MPIYEYKCLDCGAHLEKMQKFSDEPLKICEKCGGKLEKQLSLSGFQFKGAGWYVTDYAGKKTEKGADKNAKPESKSESKSDGGEKNSVAESTAKPDSASNNSGDKKVVSTKDSASKKD